MGSGSGEVCPVGVNSDPYKALEQRMNRSRAAQSATDDLAAALAIGVLKLAAQGTTDPPDGQHPGRVGLPHQPSG